MKKRLLTLVFVLLLVCICPAAALADGNVTANSDPAAVTPADFTFTATSLAPFNNGYELCTAVEQADGTWALPVPVTAVAATDAYIKITAPNGYTEPFSVTYKAYENNAYYDNPPEKTVQSENGIITITDHFVVKKAFIRCSDLQINIGNYSYQVVFKPYAEISGISIHNLSNLYYTIERKPDATFYSEVDAEDNVELQIGTPNYGNILFKFLINGEANFQQFTLNDSEERSFSITIGPKYESAGFDETTYYLTVKGVAARSPVLLNYNNTAVTYDEIANLNQQTVIALETQNTDENTVYQWEGNGTQGTDPSTFSVNTSKHGIFNIQCTVTNTVNGVDYSAHTGTIRVWVSPEGNIDPPEFSIQPVAAEYYVGYTATPLNAQAEPFTNAVKITYQWYSNTSASNSGGTAVSEPFGSPGRPATFTPPTTEAGSTWYYCQAVAEWLCLTENGYVTYTSEPSVTEAVEIRVTSAEVSFSGSGTPGDPYLLKTYADLKELRDRVAMGSSFDGLYFKMAGDLTLSQDWEPIGNSWDTRFSGSIDGDGHTLTVPENGLPLLGYVMGAEVKNLYIYGAKINGYGLVNNYGITGKEGTAITIDNVTLKSGTQTLKAGFIGGDTTGFSVASAGYIVVIKNCTAESGVIIGYDGNQSKNGTFADRINGTITNCTSAATVKGKSYVGGILGSNDNAMYPVTVNGCTFTGTVIASGDHAGGIVGGGYDNSTAPNGIKLSIINCYVGGSITGKNKVGGILGGDSWGFQAWNDHTIKGNTFTGTVTATNGTYAGGIIGYYANLNKHDLIYNNTCNGKAYGLILSIDTSHSRYADNDTVPYGVDPATGTYYYNSAVDNLSTVDEQLVFQFNVNTGYKFVSQRNHNRTDDPLGTGGAVVVSALTISGSYKNVYETGESFDPTGMVVTAEYSDGSTASVDVAQVTFTGFDSATPGKKTVTAAYGGVTATFTVQVLAPANQEITVKLTVLGDEHHEMAEGETGHGLWVGGLVTWLPETSYTVSANASVFDLICQAFDGVDSLTLFSRYTQQYSSEYIYAVQKDDVLLTEKDNCKNSGWMVAINGKHTQVGVSLMTLANGDSVILHWCDDYLIDEAEGVRQAFRASKPAIKAEVDKKTGQVKLTITPVSGALKYRILVAEAAEGPFTLAAETEEENWTFEGTPGTKYFFKVVAVNGTSVESAESAVVSIVRLPGQVTGLKATSKKKQVTLKWKKVTGAKKYFVYMSKNGKSGWKKVGTTTKTTYVYKKGTVGKKLYFRVLAVTANGKKGEFSKVVSIKVKK